jgi:hypothetical protein
MRFNLKVIVVGGLAMYVAQFALSMITGPVIHEGILTELYQANASFWRPELNQQPPDMAALMPRWIATGLIGAFILAGIFDNIRGGLEGSMLVRGAKYGVILFLINLCIAAGWSGVFNLPDAIWAWWLGEALLYYVVGGVVLGWVTGKLAPEA